MKAERLARPAKAPVEPARSRAKPVQRRLAVGASTDPLEREADTIAAEVMAALSADGPGIGSATAANTTPRIARRAAASIGAEGGDVDADTERAITSARGGGQPLGGKIRNAMEGAFGADFSNVRMHVGPQADALNRRIQARAFTTGADIFMRRQDYAPGSAAGQELLAHELAHTVQQGASSIIARRIDSKIRPLSSSSERIQRDDTKLDGTQQAQYMELGPGLGDFAKRSAPKTTASEGGIVEALAVLPRNDDGSLTPEAIQMIELFEKGVWDTSYEKWMDEKLPVPARKKGLFGAESDKDFRKRMAKAARDLPGSKNELTGRTKNPELANLSESTGLPDKNVSEKTSLANVGVTLNYNESDVNAGERIGMISQAFAKIMGTGGVLGNDLVINLPKYGRSMSMSGDCKTLNVSNFGTRAVFVAPKMVHLSSEILGNPNQDKEQSTGKERLKFLSAALDPEGVASIVHELGHYCHYCNNPSSFHSLNSAGFKGKDQVDLAMQVSGYAAGNPREFVAEVFLALVYGRPVDPKAIEMYMGLGGMPVGAAK